LEKLRNLKLDDDDDVTEYKASEPA